MTQVQPPQTPYDQINQHPTEFAAWVAGLQRNAATQAGVDPVYAEVAQKYGYFAAYLQQPEIGPILRKAAAQGWSAELLQGAISNTQWWHTYSAGQRELQQLQMTDPASYGQKFNSKVIEIQSMAAKMGLRWSDSTTLNQIASQALGDPSITEAELQWMLGSQMHFDNHTPVGGSVGGTMASAKQRAADYMVNITDQKAFDYAKGIAMGVRTPDDIELELKNQAKSQYSWLAPELDAGHTMKDLFDSHIATMAQLLEVDPESIDLRDPKYNKILSTTDPNTGVRRSMTTTEAEEYVRGTADYDSTKGAMDKAAGFSENLMRTFGKVSV